MELIFETGHRGLICRNPPDNGPWIVLSDRYEHAAPPKEGRLVLVEIVGTATSGRLRFARILEDIDSTRESFEAEVRTEVLARLPETYTGPFEISSGGREFSVRLLGRYEHFVNPATEVYEPRTRWRKDDGTLVVSCLAAEPNNRQDGKPVFVLLPHPLPLAHNGLAEKMAGLLAGGAPFGEDCPEWFDGVRQKLDLLAKQIKKIDAHHQAESLLWPRRTAYQKEEWTWKPAGFDPISIYGYGAMREWLLAEVQKLETKNLRGLANLTVPDFSELFAKLKAEEEAQVEREYAEIEQKARELPARYLAELEGAKVALTNAKEELLRAEEDYRRSKEVNDRAQRAWRESPVSSQLGDYVYDGFVREHNPLPEPRCLESVPVHMQNKFINAWLQDHSEHEVAYRAPIDTEKARRKAWATYNSVEYYVTQTKRKVVELEEDSSDRAARDAGLLERLTAMEPWAIGERRDITFGELYSLSPRHWDKTWWKAEKTHDSSWTLRAECLSSCEEDSGQIRRDVLLISKEAVEVEQKERAEAEAQAAEAEREATEAERQRQERVKTRMAELRQAEYAKCPVCLANLVQEQEHSCWPEEEVTRLEPPGLKSYDSFPIKRSQVGNHILIEMTARFKSGEFKLKIKEENSTPLGVPEAEVTTEILWHVPGVELRRLAQELVEAKQELEAIEAQRMVTRTPRVELTFSLGHNPTTGQAQLEATFMHQGQLRRFVTPLYEGDHNSPKVGQTWLCTPGKSSGSTITANPQIRCDGEEALRTKVAELEVAVKTAREKAEGLPTAIASPSPARDATGADQTGFNSLASKLQGLNKEH